MKEIYIYWLAITILFGITIFILSKTSSSFKIDSDYEEKKQLEEFDRFINEDFKE